MTRLRIVVAAASGLRRAALARLLEDAGFDSVGQAGEAGDLLRKVRAHRPHVVVAELPEAYRRRDEWARAVLTMRGRLPGVGVLLIARHAEPQNAAALLELDAAGTGYLLEARLTVARFVDAVRQIADGGSVLDPEVVTRLAGRPRPDPVIDALSERDRDVLAQMAAGVTNHGIARRMFLSERAIERHVTSIFAKLGISSASHANRRVLAVLAYLRATAPA